MADNKSNSMLGEISTIRNILMGQQMDEYENRFSEMKTDLEATQKALRDNLDQLGTDTDKRFDKLEKDIAARFDKLEKILTDSVEKLNQRMDKMSKKDKNALGKMLASMGQKLMDE